MGNNSHIIETVSATVSIMRLFKVTEELDKNEGRGGTRVVGYFASKDAADAGACDKGVMGGPGPVKELVCEVVTYKHPFLGSVKVQLLGDDIVVLEEDPVVVRARALSKLSDADRLELGLK